MKKIVTFIPTLEPYYDRIINIQEINRNNGLQAQIFTYNSVIPENLDLDGVEFFRIPKKFRFIKSFYIIIKLKEWREILVIDWFKATPILGFYARLLKGSKYYFFPVIADYGFIYNIATRKIRIFPKRYIRIRLVESFRELLIIFCSDKVVLQSYGLLEYYRKVYKIDINRLDVNHNRFSKNSRPQVVNTTIKRIGIVGNIEQHKGIDEILELALSFTGIDFHFYGGGKGVCHRNYVGRINGLANCYYHGKLPTDEINKAYEFIDLLLFPSYHEGSPRALLEFLRFNKPVVSTILPGLDFITNLEDVNLVQYHDITHMRQIINEYVMKGYNIERDLSQVQTNIIQIGI